MSYNILLHDLDLIETRPLSRLRSIFSQRNGVFTTIERCKLKYPNCKIFLKHTNQQYETLVAEIEGINTFTNSQYFEKDMDLIITSELLSPFSMINHVATMLEDDLKLLNTSDFINTDFNVVGDNTKLYINKKTNVLPNCVFDTRDGVIIIEEGTEISPFTYIAGPVFIGKNCKIDNVRITGGCIIGNEARIGGEVENSIINDYSNKHHEGFLGHSVLGSWVNLGALTTTSDLKNNYGIIRIALSQDFIPTYPFETTDVSTKSIKFGSIIGDCSKIGIGIMLNTGSVVDCGCNLWGKAPEKYTPPFSWGEMNTKYKADKFVDDCKKIFARRKKTPHKNLLELAFLHNPIKE